MSCRECDIQSKYEQPQIACDTCIFSGERLTTACGYPLPVYLAYCKKLHWDGNYMDDEDWLDNVNNCVDYKKL